jgi:S1-C subfamily serine protease
MVPLLFAAVLVPHQPPAGPEPNIPVKVMAAAAATVRVTNQGTDFRTGSGVTFGVRDGYAYVLTANHVLGQDGDRRVEFFKLDKQNQIHAIFTVQPTDVIVAARQVTADFAILKVSLPRVAKSEGDSKPPTAHKSEGDSKPPTAHKSEGDSKPPTDPKSAAPPVPQEARLAPPFERPKRFPAKVYSAGFDKPPKDVEKNPTAEVVPTVTETILIGKRFKRSGAELAILWETDKPQEEGRSGGPLLDTEGRIIGVCLAYDKISFHGRFVHLDEIQAWMKKNGFAWAVEDK